MGRRRRRPKNSPSRERFRPPSRPTFRFRVQLLGTLRPTGAPCSAQQDSMQRTAWRSRPGPNEFRAICGGLADRASARFGPLAGPVGLGCRHAREGPGGGGVGVCSALYWPPRLGWEDVVLVERAELTSGSTFHSAGLVGQLRSSLALTRLMMWGVGGALRAAP